MRKKLISVIAAMALMAAFTVFEGHAELSVSAQAAILYEANTGTVLYEKNPDKQMLIASTTKLMTALVALENASLEELVEIPKACETIEGSSLYLKAGEKLTMRELLYGLMLESGNDAAVAVACHISGSVEAFAELMNERAEKLGLENTHFVNPHGLNAEGHYSSARDLALLMAEAMDNALFAQIVSTKTISFGGRTFQNHNKLMWSYDGMVAGKTGYTKKAGRTLVTVAERDGMRLICVTLSAPDDWEDHTRLYDMGFASYDLVTVCEAGVPMAEIPVISGAAETVSVAARETVRLLVPKGEEPQITLWAPDFVYAKVQQGARAGTVSVVRDGEEPLRIELYFCESVERDETQKLTGLERLKKLITEKWRE